MAFDYSSIRKLASQQIKQFGMAMTLRHIDGKVYDPATGTYTAGSVKDYPAIGILTDDVQVKGDKDLIQKGDKWVLLEAQDLAVSPGAEDQIVISGVAWNIVQLMAISPGGVVLLYQMQVRK